MYFNFVIDSFTGEIIHCKLQQQQQQQQQQHQQFIYPLFKCEVI